MTLIAQLSFIHCLCKVGTKLLISDKEIKNSALTFPRVRDIDLDVRGTPSSL